ncbi:SusC/RagA family TonB-linked outer membrane protein [Puia sp.]|uniref:SusC/RagA family TonB-linked outer membrane protein n=1 Tax=Puia sp. TaxID=2045100 RepID=UPI002F3FCA2C
MTLQRMARYSLALLLLFLHHSMLYAQKKSVSGNVYNKDTKEPMMGVTVNVKGTSTSVITDNNGFFAITPPARMKVVYLTFSYIGFGSMSVKVDSTTPLTVNMSATNKSMDDVIVVGYGTQKRSNVLGAVSVVSGKELEDLPAVNMSTSLINTIPGVGVSQTSGKPGATTNLTIRGATTFATGGSTSPLYVIDGLVPIIASSGSTDPTGKTAFDLLDPSEVESITFLKDASATIYGARGANGVVLVTTKRGRPGKPRVSYSGSYIHEDASKVPKMIDGYDQALLLNNWVQNYDPYKVVPSEIYTQQELDSIRFRTHNQRNMWFNKSWKPGYAQRHNLSVSGGSDKITLFAGANYYNEIGNLPNDTHQKYGIELGANAKVTDDLTLDVVLGYNTGYNNQPVPKGISVTDQSDQENGYVGTMLTTPSFIPETSGGRPLYYAATKYNPLAFQQSGSYTKDNSETFNVNFSANYKIPFVKGLSIHGQYGRNTYNDFSKQWFVPYNAYNFKSPGVHTNKTAGGINTPTSTQNVMYFDTVSSVTKVTNSDQLAEVYNNSKNWQATEGIEFARIFGKHNLDIALYAEQSQTEGQFLKTYRQQQVIPGVDQYFAYSANSANWDAEGYQTSTGRASYLGRLSYTFNEKYMLQAAFRDDASPQFPTEHQWGFFPSVSVGWLASNEDWWQKFAPGINDFKVRLNVGLTGNDATSSFSWAQQYTASNPIGYLFGTTGQYAANGLQTTTTPNPDITWERALMKDLGFDGTFANRKFHFSVDLWYKHQYDMLDIPTSSVPNTYGGSIANFNYGILNSWGDEFQVGYNGRINKDWSVFATVNFGFSINGNNKVIRTYYSSGTDTGYKYPIGKPTDLGISGYKSSGIVRSQDAVNAWYAKHPGWTINGDSLRPGDLNFVDVNGDGIIDANDQTQIAKHSNAAANIGYILGAQWKSLRVSTNIAMSLGGKEVLPKVDITPPTKDAAGLDMWKHSYTAWKTDALLPAIYAPLANQSSTFWLRSSTYVYVNNLQISWSLPKSFIGKYKIPDARLYLTGMNLWTIVSPTPYRDPRSGEITDYPILRTWTFGLNVNL